MPESSYNIKRVAKNTVILYVRMFFMMLISLYTTRVILNTLGVEDYGVYNVVGGFVGMFGILTSSLSTAISRFITFGLGKRDLEALQKIYSTAIIIQISMAVINPASIGVIEGRNLSLAPRLRPLSPHPLQKLHATSHRKRRNVLT